MPLIYSTSQNQDFIPAVYMDRILLETSNRDLTSVWLDLSMKDKLDDPESSWLLQEDFRDFVKIRIIQSNSQKATDKIVNKDPSQITQGLQDYKHWDFWLKDVVDPDKNKYLADPIFGSDGELIYNIPFKFQFDTMLEDHFSIFAYAYVDLHEIATQRGLDFPKGTFTNNTIGAVSGETVLNNNKVVSESSVFLTVGENGDQVWTGRIEQDPKNKIYYIPGTSPRQILKKVSIPNYKVQDFRDIDRLGALPPDITSAKYAFREVQKSLLNGTTLNFGETTEDYFSPGLTSRDEDGRVSFIFDIDFENLLRNNTVFGALLDTPAKEVILKNSRISEMKVYRRRVKRQTTSSKLGTTIDDISIFNQNEPWEMIAIGAEPLNVRFLSKNSYYGGAPKVDKTKENLIGVIGEIRRSPTQEHLNIRKFVSLDNSLTDKTFGLYQYGISLEVEDGSVVFLQKSLNELVNSLDVMRGYYSVATSANYYDAFTRRFKKRLVALYKKLKKSPWQSGILTYIRALSSLVELEKERSIEIIKELNAISNPTTGTPEGVAALIKLMERLENLIFSVLSGKVKISDQQTDGRPSKIYNNNNYEKFMINYDYFFNSYVDSDTPIGDGLQILPTSSPVLYLKDFKERAKTEAAKYYNADSPGEIQKNIGQIAGLTPEISGIANVTNAFYTFFSPQSVSAGGQQLNLQDQGNSLWDTNKYERFTSYLLQSANSPKASFPIYPTNSTGDPKLSSKDSAVAPSADTLQLLEGILSGYSVTIRATLSENKETKETIPVAPPDCDIDFSQGTIKPQNKKYDPFVSRGISTLGSIFTSAASFNNSGKDKNNRNKNSQPPIQPVMGNFDLTTNVNYIDTFVRKSKIQKGQLEELPNQISSLFLSKSPIVKNNWQNYEQAGIDFPANDKTDLMFMYNYSTLFKIEFQDGYQKSKEGRTLMKQPIWKEFSEKTLARVETGEVLLCRIEKYENTEMGIVHSDLLDLPIIDKCFFFVKNKSTLNKVENPAPKKRRKADAQRTTLEKINKSVNYDVAPFSRGLIMRKE